MESSQGSSDISWFKTVPFAFESTQSKFRQRFYEGTSLSSIMPSVSRSWRYFLLLARNRASQSSPMIRLTEFRPFGCHICPDVSKTCCNAGEDLAVQDLAECLGVLQVPIQFSDALFIISGDSGQISLGSCGLRGDMKWTLFHLSHGTSRLNGSEAKSVVRFCLPPGGFICACLSWRCSTCGQGCILLLRFSV